MKIQFLKRHAFNKSPSFLSLYKNSTTLGEITLLHNIKNNKT